MKKIKNLSVYNLLGYLLLGIAAYAFINANNTNLQANSEVTQEQNGRQGDEETSTQRPPQSTPNRHTITLVLNELDELKVTEGQRINVGDIISDRTSTRTKLQAKKKRLEAAITKASLPLNQLKPVPVPRFQTELAALKQAQFNLDVIVREIENFDKNFHHKDPWHVQVFESEKVQQLAGLKRRELEASINVEQAIARLDEAKLNYQKQQYEHSLKVSDYQTSLQKQQEQVNSLQLQLDKVNDELETLVSVYSPYRGKVRRVKVLNQSDRNINVEVTLDVRGGS
jgi:chromosome segregation ATPase